MTFIGSTLHISDLHFSEELTEKGRSLWPKVLHYGLNSHSFGKVDALSAKVAELILIGSKPDVLIATGDITTNGSETSLGTAIEFIRSEEIRRGKSNRLVTEGLNYDEKSSLIIPGNHDRYADPRLLPLQQPNRLLEEKFNIGYAYPYVVGFRQGDYRQDINYPALLFFIFDSTSTEFAEGQNPVYKIARGFISEAECRWLVRQVENIRINKEARGIDGEPLVVDYDASIRIALLHHHPISDLGSESDGKWTLMENSLSFIKACSEVGIDVVLFGHQHRAKYHLMRTASNSHGTHFFCCPSTSEFSEIDNGFYMFSFEDKAFTVDSYKWDNGSFIKTSAPPYSYYREIGRRSKTTP